MLCRICSVVSREEATGPNGEGSMRRYFCGEEVDEEPPGDDEMIGAHLLLLGEAQGLISGSKSMVRFRVAPQAMLCGHGNKENKTKSNANEGKRLPLPGSTVLGPAALTLLSVLTLA